MEKLGGTWKLKVGGELKKLLGGLELGSDLRNLGNGLKKLGGDTKVLGDGLERL